MMQQVSNPILVLIPGPLLGPVITLMLILGGLAFVVGARRWGKAMVVAAVTLPFVRAATIALRDMALAMAPDALVKPITFILILVLAVSLAWRAMVMLFGRHVIDEALGHLLADFLRHVMLGLIRRPLAVIAVLAVLYVAWVAT